MTQAKQRESYWHGSMHEWFGLTYASYLVIPRTLLQGMPEEWQAKFAALLDECRETYDSSRIADNYRVNLVDGGRFVRDPLRDYRHPPALPYRESPSEEGEPALPA
ncbi:hypothetical protein [Burkholderia anthina]|uniref:hypothetical protein n=1 Tax=Burkholderia anthina TaxID=179879 RepID=UPI00158E1A35|nr:hypothetical protein [Burkholderia anthina]